MRLAQIYGRDRDLQLCLLVATAQTRARAPKHVTDARRQHAYPGYYSFISVQWEEEVTHLPHYLCTWARQEVMS